MTWKVFERKWGKGKFEVSITPAGKIGISHPIFERWFKGCQGVILAYDDKKHRIGLKPTSEPCENMYSFIPYRTVSYTHLTLPTIYSV